VYSYQERKRLRMKEEPASRAKNGPARRGQPDNARGKHAPIRRKKGVAPRYRKKKQICGDHLERVTLWDSCRWWAQAPDEGSPFAPEKKPALEEGGVARTGANKHSWARRPEATSVEERTLLLFLKKKTEGRGEERPGARTSNFGWTQPYLACPENRLFSQSLCLPLTGGESG